MGKGEDLHHRATGLPSGLAGQHGLECPRIGRPRKQAVAVDQAEERHRLAPQRVDDVAVVDHVTVPPVGLPPPPRQRELMGAAEIDLEPVVMEPDPQPVADQTRGHAVEHLA